MGRPSRRQIPLQLQCAASLVFEQCTRFSPHGDDPPYGRTVISIQPARTLFRCLGGDNGIAEGSEEFSSELLRGGIDQAAAQLSKLAADLRIDLILQYCDIWAFFCQCHQRTAL